MEALATTGLKQRLDLSSRQRTLSFLPLHPEVRAGGGELPETWRQCVEGTCSPCQDLAHSARDMHPQDTGSPDPCP